MFAPSRLSRRAFLSSTTAFLAAAAVGMRPEPAEAFIGFLLRGLTLGGARAGAAGLAGRSALAGYGVVRPVRPAYARNSYGAQAPTAGRLVFQAGRWLHQRDSSPYLAQYSDEGEYQSDYARYPGVFGAAPATLWIENTGWRNEWFPESDLYLSFDDGHVWQAYQVGELCVPPGVARYDFALPGVPTGWGYSGVFSNDYASIESDFIPA